MRKLLLSFLLLLAYSSYSRSTLFVQDSAKLFTDNERYLLNDKLQAFEKKTSNEIAIITIPDLKDNDISEYAIKLHHDKGIGKKGVDNGLLILIAPNSRKCFISVGYGLEQYLPDLIVNRIGEKDLPVYFKQKQYYKGIDNSLNDIFTILDKVNPEIIEKYQQEQKRKQEAYEQNTTFVLQIVGLIFLLGVIGYILWYQNQKRLEKLEQEKIEQEKTLSLKKQIKDKYFNIDYMISRISNYKISDNKNLLLKLELDKHNNYTYNKESFETITNNYELNKLFNNASDIYISLNKFYDKLKEIDNIRNSLTIQYSICLNKNIIQNLDTRMNCIPNIDIKDEYSCLDILLKKYILLDNVEINIKTLEINDNNLEYLNSKITEKKNLIKEIENKVYILNDICLGYELAIKHKNEISLDSLELLRNKATNTVKEYSLFDKKLSDSNKKLEYLKSNYNLLDIFTLGALLFEAYNSYKNIDTLVDNHKEEFRRQERERKRLEEEDVENIRREEKRRKDREDDERNSYTTSSNLWDSTPNTSSFDSGSTDFGGSIGSGGGGSEINW